MDDHRAQLDVEIFKRLVAIAERENRKVSDLVTSMMLRHETRMEQVEETAHAIIAEHAELMERLK